VERAGIRIDRMVGGIQEDCGYADYWKAGHHAAFARSPYSAFDPANQIVREHIRRGLVDERHFILVRRRLETELHPGKVRRILPLVRVVAFNGVADRFAISDLWRTDIHLDAELALEAKDQCLEFELAKAFENG